VQSGLPKVLRLKSVALVANAIRDCSHRKGIVLDAFVSQSRRYPVSGSGLRPASYPMEQSVRPLRAAVPGGHAARLWQSHQGSVNCGPSVARDHYAKQIADGVFDDWSSQIGRTFARDVSKLVPPLAMRRYRTPKERFMPLLALRTRDRGC
jgi:hypothetical protein